MRIALDAKRAFNNHRGLGQYARQLIAGLSEADLDLILYSAGKNKVQQLPLEQMPKVHLIQKQGLAGALWRRMRLGRQAVKDGAALFHGLSNELPSDLPRSLPAVVSIHDLLFLEHPYLYPPLDRKIYEWKVRQAAEKADVIAVTSDTVKEAIGKYFPGYDEKAQTVYQCADPVFFNPVDLDFPLPLPPEFVLCVGAIEERKNQLSLLKAMQLAKLDLPLVLVGNGKRYWKDIQFWAKKYGWEKRILQVSGISNEQLASLYQKASFLAYPSMNEGFGIPLAEAMASGTPILTSNGAVFREVCGDAAVFVDPLSIDSIAEGVEQILSSELKSQLRNNAEKRKMMFSRQAFASRMIEIYKALV